MLHSASPLEDALDHDLDWHNSRNTEQNSSQRQSGHFFSFPFTTLDKKKLLAPTSRPIIHEFNLQQRAEKSIYEGQFAYVSLSEIMLFH